MPRACLPISSLKNLNSSSAAVLSRKSLCNIILVEKSYFNYRVKPVLLALRDRRPGLTKLVPTNQNSIEVPKVVEPTNKKEFLQNFGEQLKKQPNVPSLLAHLFFDKLLFDCDQDVTARATYSDLLSHPFLEKRPPLDEMSR